MLERLSGDELMQKLFETARRADRAPRRGWQVGGHRRPLALRPRRRAPHRHPHRRPRAKSRSAMKVAEERRFKDYRTDEITSTCARHEGGAAPPASAHPHRPGHRARPRRDHRRDLPQRRRDRAGLPPRAQERPAAAAADGRGRNHGSLLRAREPPAHRPARGARAARLRGLLLPQLRLRCCSAAKRPACCAARPSAHRRPAAHVSTRAGR